MMKIFIPDQTKTMLRIPGLLGLLFIFFFSACVSPEQLRKENVFFNEGLDTAKLSQYQLVEPVIQKGDLLQITISSRSSSSNLLFSQNYSGGTGTVTGVSASAVSGSGTGANGYLVDITTGDIKLPLLGIIHADGMTKLELEKEIIKRSTEFLKEDPIVNIRYLNFRVTFLGSVAVPGSKIFESERVSFLQALGEVGGVAPGGDLKTILLSREQNGKRTMHYIDLTNGDFFNSPNYYLKQNDVVYVAPTKRQLVNSDQSTVRTLQYVSFGLSAVNIILLFITFFR